MKPNAVAQDLCDYLNASPSPFHAVAETIRRLASAGFTPLDERAEWSLRPGDARYVTRSDASIIAFRVGRRSPVETGFRIVGAHTDSPNLRLKPHVATGREGYAQLAIEVYGGVLLHTWLDRDLGLAGRLVVEQPDGTLSRHVARLHAPVCRVPSLAIHLDREVNDKGLVLNKQQHLAPLFALGDPETSAARVLAELAASCQVDPAQIRGFDVGLYDVNPATLGGLDESFLFGARLDNLASCHAATSALAAAGTDSESTRLVALFDHEEVGSASAQGAAGTFLRDVLTRIVECTDPSEPGRRGGFARAMAQSYCVSADMAHAVHPNYVDRHEPKHMPRLGSGPVIKTNVQQRYATDALSAAKFRQLCRDADVAFQDFVTRTDLACGSTIGPITATGLGIATVDVGNPMLSMHSTREMCGASDVGQMLAVMGRLFG